MLIPGGGPTTDLIRDFDKRFLLGEARAHWLALRALALNAHILAAILPGTVVIDDKKDLHLCWLRGQLPVLDPHALLFQLESNGVPTLPHSWEAASDSVAACLAQALDARRLILLKSIKFPRNIDWPEAGRQGLVDPLFAETLRRSERSLEVQAVCLKA